MVVQIYSYVYINIFNFQIESSSYAPVASLPNSRVFTFQAVQSVNVANLNWTFNMSSSKLSNFLTAFNIAESVTISNCTLRGDSSGTTTEPAILMSLSNTTESFNLVNSHFEGFGNLEGIGFLNALGNGQITIENCTFQNIRGKEAGVLSINNFITI